MLTSRSETIPANGARISVSPADLRASATRARAASSDRYDWTATFCAIWYCWRAAPPRARGPAPRLDLRGVRGRFVELRRGLRGGDAHEQRAGGDARAPLDRRGDHAAGGFRADLRLLLSEARSGHAQVPRDRTALGDDSGNRQPLRLRRLGPGPAGGG